MNWVSLLNFQRSHLVISKLLNSKLFVVSGVNPVNSINEEVNFMWGGGGGGARSSLCSGWICAFFTRCFFTSFFLQPHHYRKNASQTAHQDFSYAQPESNRPQLDHNSTAPQPACAQSATRALKITTLQASRAAVRFLGCVWAREVPLLAPREPRSAVQEDTGPVWANHAFPCRSISKSAHGHNELRPTPLPLVLCSLRPCLHSLSLF